MYYMQEASMQSLSKLDLLMSVLGACVCTVVTECVLDRTKWHGTTSIQLQTHTYCSWLYCVLQTVYGWTEEQKNERNRDLSAIPECTLVG